MTGHSGVAARLAGRHVLVTGAGVTGPPVARALLALGARVTVTDRNAERLAALAARLPAAHVECDLVKPPSDVDLVVTAPGWRPDSPVFEAARAEGVDVVGDVELAWWLGGELPEPPTWLVVTGTNGKTTTVTMLERMLLAAGLDAVACGNVGLPVVSAIAAGHRVLAVELSSFQLYWAPSVRPAAGALLNIAEDHLDWHGTMDAYTAAKARALTGDVAIGGVEDPRVAGLLAQSPAATKIPVRLGPPAPGELGLLDGRLTDRAFADDAPGTPLADVAAVRPPGPIGVFDALVAAALARAHGVPPDAVADGLAAFEPGEHRSAAVGELDGVRYVNDSKATNPHAAAASLRAHDRVVWLAGGLLKGAHVDDLVADVAPRLAGVVLFGRDRAVIAAALARHAPDVPVRTVSAVDDDPMSVMSAAVCAARVLARPGDVVLLAPAAASMDQFVDYRHRGRAFADAVAELAAERE